MAYLRSQSTAFLLFSYLALFSISGWAAPVLTIGTTDTNKYGYAYDNIFTHQLEAEFEFNQSQDDLLLSLSAFDVDTAIEIQVELNGTSIGYLPKSANNATINASFSIPQTGIQPCSQY